MSEKGIEFFAALIGQWRQIKQQGLSK